MTLVYCPNCKRRLLSHASSKCNWCGEEIHDEGYQAEANVKKAEFRAYEMVREAVEDQKLAAMESAIYNPNALLNWMPVRAGLRQRSPLSPPMPGDSSLNSEIRSLNADLIAAQRIQTERAKVPEAPAVEPSEESKPTNPEAGRFDRIEID